MKPPFFVVNCLLPPQGMQSPVNIWTPFGAFWLHPLHFNGKYALLFQDHHGVQTLIRNIEDELGDMDRMELKYFIRESCGMGIKGELDIVADIVQSSSIQVECGKSSSSLTRGPSSIITRVLTSWALLSSRIHGTISGPLPHWRPFGSSLCSQYGVAIRSRAKVPNDRVLGAKNCQRRETDLLSFEESDSNGNTGSATKAEQKADQLLL